MSGTWCARAACCLVVLASWAPPGGTSAAEIAEGISLTGDLRLRHESLDRNAAFGEDDVDHARMRVRVGVGAKLDGNWDVGLRFATGGGMTSTNQDLDALGGKVQFYVDRAFARYRTGERRFELFAGRTPNPYISSAILWDSDYNPDGLVEKFAFGGESARFFVNAGQHVIGQVSENDRSYGPSFYGLQPGIELKAGGASIVAACAYYHFARAAGTDDVPDDGRYAVIDLYGCAVLKTPGGFPISLWADALFNLEAENDGSAYGVGVCVGSSNEKGKVQAKMFFVTIERDAMWIDLGDGTLSAGLARQDMRAFVLGATVGLGGGATLGATWYSRDAVYTDAHEDKLEVDLVLKF